MSASLVGSEMCIRDSPHTGHASGAVARGLGAPRSLGGALRRRPRWRSSVSYTHLTLPTICSV
eukprot:9206216-Alexandrium_andersonii.AAC.1